MLKLSGSVCTQNLGRVQLQRILKLYVDLLSLDNENNLFFKGNKYFSTVPDMYLIQINIVHYQGKKLCIAVKCLDYHCEIKIIWQKIEVKAIFILHHRRMFPIIDMMMMWGRYQNRVFIIIYCHQVLVGKQSQCCGSYKAYKLIPTCARFTNI